MATSSYIDTYIYIIDYPPSSYPASATGLTGACELSTRMLDIGASSV